MADFLFIAGVDGHLVQELASGFHVGVRIVGGEENPVYPDQVHHAEIGVVGQPVGITSHDAALTIDEFIGRYEAASGIKVENRSWYRALNAFKMAVICLIGAMLVDQDDSDDPKLVLAAGGTHLLTQVGLADLGITEYLESGPVDIRQERIAELESRGPLCHAAIPQASGQ